MSCSIEQQQQQQQHCIIPYRRYKISHGSLTETQVDSINKLPGQLRQPFLETAARERQRYWQRSREALVAYGRQRTQEERKEYRDVTDLLEQRRQMTYTSDIDAVCVLYARLKQSIMDVLLYEKQPSPPPPTRTLILRVAETNCASLQEWRVLYPYLYMTLQALQYELIQSGWSSYYYITEANDIEPNRRCNYIIYFLCDLNE